MDRTEAENREQIGSVKEVVNIFGQRILGEIPERKKTKMVISENLPSRTREVRLAKRDIGRLDDRRRFAEAVKAKAEMELSDAQKTVNDLTLRIEDSNAATKAQNKELQVLKKKGRRYRERATGFGEINNHHQYTEVMRELEGVKQELSKLKVDMASVLDVKMQAEKQSEGSNSKARLYASSMEALKKEIEEVNEEEVLVELARMEAVREFKAIEDQRRAEAAQFSTTMEKTRTRIENLIQEINNSKELEMKLEITNSDVDVSQSELKLVKSTVKSSKNNTISLDQLNSSGTGSSKRNEDELASSSLLQSVTDELTEAKRELLRIREEGFQFMASMDIIRNELKHVSEENARLKNLEEKTESTVKNLNSKLLRAKSKLESASDAEEKARSIMSNLTATLQQLHTETEAAKKERKLISEETASIRSEIQKTEADIELEEERLQAAMQELEAVKASEALALGSLRTLTEKTMKARASTSQHSSSITISDFEYEYLTRRAEGAEEIADKKVAAAQAWIEALKTGEKEILMKTEMVQREMRELKKMEDQELYKAEKALTATKAVEGELRNWRQHEKQTNDADLHLEVPVPRKSMKENRSPMTPRRAKMRRPASPGARYVSRSSSIALRKKRKVMPSLVKFFSGKKKWLTVQR